MSTISKILKKRKGLIPYITAGDPSLAVTEKMVYKLEAAGADIIEIGIPFSDPLADGPIIQASHFRALKKGTSLGDVFKLVAKIRRKTQIPIIFMLSVNLIYKFGVKNFIAAAIRAGIQGIVIPDLPPEEEKAQDFKWLKKAKLDVILLVAPNTPIKRVQMIVKQSSGFIYLVSLAGVTGMRKSLSSTIESSVKKIKKISKLPVCVGFGVSNAKQAAAVAQVSNGVIVGSAIVKRLSKASGMKNAAKFVKTMRRAIDAAR